ncbi:MAG TPA: hypothetical protein PK360_12000, partial [bacterium]|nr:hypothetical protein [bacterium]
MNIDMLVSSISNTCREKYPWKNILGKIPAGYQDTMPVRSGPRTIDRPLNTGAGGQPGHRDARGVFGPAVLTTQKN